MPREGGWREAGKPRVRYKTDAKPQKPGKSLAARLASFDRPSSEGGMNGGKPGYHKPGSQNPRK